VQERDASAACCAPPGNRQHPAPGTCVAGGQSERPPRARAPPVAKPTGGPVPAALPAAAAAALPLARGGHPVAARRRRHVGVAEGRLGVGETETLGLSWGSEERLRVRSQVACLVHEGGMSRRSQQRQLEGGRSGAAPGRLFIVDLVGPGATGTGAWLHGGSPVLGGAAAFWWTPGPEWPPAVSAMFLQALCNLTKLQN
jgi:hypothetical protein